jgi:hypothetical protein
MRFALLLMAVSLAPAEPPADVLKFFRTAAEALANNDPRTFMAKFDRDLPGYVLLRDEIEGLLAAHEVGSTIEVVNDEGDGQRRALQLDWLLSITDLGLRRQIVKCKIERRGREWKITQFEPIQFFKSD